jgi:hypothetical protein
MNKMKQWGIYGDNMSNFTKKQSKDTFKQCSKWNRLDPDLKILKIYLSVLKIMYLFDWKQPKTQTTVLTSSKRDISSYINGFVKLQALLIR